MFEKKSGIVMKIVVLDGYTLNPGDLSWDGFKEIGDINIFDRTEYINDRIVESIADAEIVLTNKTPMSADVIKRVKGLKYIGVLATGYNVVDTAAAREYGIIVTNIPAYSTMSVAQLTFALILEICHHAGAHSDAVLRGEWSKSIDFCFWKYPLVELSGKTLGIIGFGRIGRATAEIAQAFGLNVLAYDIVQSAEPENEKFRYVTLEQLLEESDIISLHAPLFESTREIINSDTITKMKDGVWLINTSRGQLVNEKDLFNALQSGKISWAAVDVVSAEPIATDNPLLKARNIIITPHIAWAPLEARARLMNIAVGNLKAYLSGAPVNVVS